MPEPLRSHRAATEDALHSPRAKQHFGLELVTEGQAAVLTSRCAPSHAQTGQCPLSPLQDLELPPLQESGWPRLAAEVADQPCSALNCGSTDDGRGVPDSLQWPLLWLCGLWAQPVFSAAKAGICIGEAHVTGPQRSVRSQGWVPVSLKWKTSP